MTKGDWELSLGWISGIALGIELIDQDSIDEPPYSWGLILDLLILRLILKVV